MPNWCDNSLHIEGSPGDVERFFTENKGDKQVLSFEKSLPVPQGEDSYDWCIQNWGTKWDADIDGKELDDIDHDDDLNWITYNFSTAWAPPAHWLRFVAKKYPTLQFNMDSEEGGNAYYGKFMAKGDAFEEQTFTQFEYYYENYPEFSDEVDRIRSMPYKKFLKEFSDGLELDDAYRGMLEAEILKRIQEKDLPMFMGIEWEYEEDNFARRMAGQSIEEEE